MIIRSFLLINNNFKQTSKVKQIAKLIILVIFTQSISMGVYVLGLTKWQNVIIIVMIAVTV